MQTSAIAKRFAATCVGLYLVCSSTVAQGVTSGIAKDCVNRLDAVTTGAAVRARADVQIRTLRELLVVKSGADEDRAFNRIEQLQKQLRGQK